MNQSLPTATFEAQHEKNLRVLRLIRDEPAWALSRILLAEQLEAERLEAERERRPD